jgi:hypothetical protein
MRSEATAFTQTGFTLDPGSASFPSSRELSLAPRIATWEAMAAHDPGVSGLRALRVTRDAAAPGPEAGQAACDAGEARWTTQG